MIGNERNDIMKFKINGVDWKIIETTNNDVMLMLDGTIRADTFL